MLPSLPSTVVDDTNAKPSSRFHLKAFVYLLVAIFGLGTWTNLAGVFIELPLIVPVLPESWQLPAKLGLIINSATLFPLLIVFASLVFKINTAPVEVPVNFVLLLSSITIAIGFAFFWDKTGEIFGKEQSIFLMMLCFFTAVADCMSSTTFIPFLHRYEPVYLNAYFTGEALTALLPALFGIAQGIGASDCIPLDENKNGTLIEVHHRPRFSVRTYFLGLSLLPFAGLVAFSILRLMQTGRLVQQTSNTTAKRSKHHQSRIFILMDSCDNFETVQTTIDTISKIEDRLRKEKKKSQPTVGTKLKMLALSEPGVFLFILFQCTAMLYGVCQGLITFSLNAYSVTTFHYTIIASQFAYPLMSVIGGFIPEVSSKIVYLLYAISSALFVYIFITAKMSPCPPFVDQLFGHVVIFLVWIAIYLVCSYIRILMGNYFRKHLGHRGLILFGVATQIGALVGAIIIFFLTNTIQLFKERDACQTTSQCISVS